MQDPIRTILIPVSLQDSTVRLVAQGARLARSFGSTVWLLHVLKLPSLMTSRRPPQELQAEKDKEIRRVHEALDSHAETLRRQGIPVNAYLLEGPDPTELILEQAHAVQADLIVMGTHGRGALYSAILGDVTHHVLREAPCPVLVVPFEGRG